MTPRAFTRMDYLCAILRANKIGLFFWDLLILDKGPVHVHHHRFVNKLAFLKLFLVGFNSPLCIKGNFEGMLALYISMFLLNLLLKYIVHFVKLFRCQHV